MQELPSEILHHFLFYFILAFGMLYYSLSVYAIAFHISL
jgi:hypothetical protein